MSAEKYPWPQWQLTAFVLDELKPDVAAQIQSAADNQPSLAAEITAIRETVAQVTQLYKHETAGIDPRTFAPVAATSVDANSLTASADDPVVFSRTTGVKVNWTAAVGLLAMAASLLIAVVLAAPGLKNYFTQSNDVLANADYAQRLATAEAKSHELSQRLEEIKAEISSAPALRRSSAAVEQSTGEQVESLVETDNYLMDKRSFAEAEVVAMRVGEIAPNPSTSRLLAASSSSARQSDPALMTKEESFIHSLNDVDSAAAPRGSVTAPTRDELSSIAPDVDDQSSEATDSKEGSGYVQESIGPDAQGKKLNLAKQSPTPSEGGMSMGGMEGMAAGGGRGGVGKEGVGSPGGIGLPSAPLSFAASPSSSSQTLPPPSYLHDDVQYFPAGENDRLSEDTALATRLKRASVAEFGTDRYASLYENPFKFVESDPLTTFSIDVDTASYVKTRQFLMQSHSLPPANAVRVEEFINYFEYEYAGPHGEDPFAANLAVATCPWRTDHKLVRIALQAKKMDVSERPKANIVFLLDVSGSMDEPNKLPLVKESMRMLIQQLGENDRVAMVVYAGAAGCVLESTTGDKQDVILGGLDRLNAGGSTNGGQGIQLAYDIARDHFVPGGVNRVILCTDGDFNVGTTSTEGLVNLVVENAKSKVFLTVLGFGMGNTNDAMMEQISNKGNGVYGFVDSRREAQRQMIKQLAGNLMTVAKDVKIQVEFNPERVASYRLIGYENRKLANEDFANDKKDAGEIGVGHRVTALYEIEPIGAAKVQPAEGLRYQKRKTEVAAELPAKVNDKGNNELLAVSLRYKQPEGDTSKLLTFPLVDANKPFAEADQDFKWAASVAQFAMLLRNSTHKGNTSWSGLIETAESLATDESRRECVDMIRAAAGMSGR